MTHEHRIRNESLISPNVYPKRTTKCKQPKLMYHKSIGHRIFILNSSQATIIQVKQHSIAIQTSSFFMSLSLMTLILDFNTTNKHLLFCCCCSKGICIVCLLLSLVSIAAHCSKMFKCMLILFLFKKLLFQ